MALYTEYFYEYLAGHELPDELNDMPVDDSGISFVDRFRARNIAKEICAETEELFSVILKAKCQECVSEYKWKLDTYIAQRDEMLSRIITLETTAGDTYGGTDTVTETRNLKDTAGGTDTATETRNLKDTAGGTDTATETRNLKDANSGTDTKNETVTVSEAFNPITDESSHLVNKTTTGTTSGITYGQATAHTGTDENKTEYGKTDSHTGTDENKTEYGKTDSHTGTDENKTEYGRTVTRKETMQRVLGSMKSNAEILQLTLDIDNLYNAALAFLDVCFMGVL